MHSTSLPARGAWVEISSVGSTDKISDVAPREGAWVEIIRRVISVMSMLVAPREGGVG